MSGRPGFPTLLTFDDLEASIFVDGKEVPHYGVETNEIRREISCWIESQAGKPFAFQYRRGRQNYDCLVKTYLDGKCVESIIIRRELRPNYLRYQPFVHISATESRCLMFGSLELTDDDAYLEDSLSEQHLGEIKIVFEQIQNIRPSASKNKGFAKLSETQKLHERSKKALSHQVKYGETVTSERISDVILDSDSCGVLATFIFKYRPLAMLQANGVAPLDPIAPTPQEESTSNPPPVNKKRKHSEAKSEQEKLAKNGGSGPSKRAKQKPQTYFTPGEVIDLT